MKKHAFLKGAFILTVAGIVVKVIGSVNRIILSRMLGGEGIGLYQMAYPIYQLALSVSSAGIPVAISILVSEKMALNDARGANRVFRLSLKLMIVTGLFFSFLLYFGAGWLVDLQIVRDPRAYWAIAALSPAIFFVTVLSSYRGYFQGMQRMEPTAVSQVAEQLIRVVTMIVLAVVLLPYGLEYAAAGASFGAGPGALAGVLVLIFYYWRYRNSFQYRKTDGQQAREEPARRIISRMVRLALPVSVANIMLPLTANIDLLIVPARLEAAGYSTETATELFGYLTGMAVALINLPTILTASLAASLVPAVAEAYTLKDRFGIYTRTATALRIALLIVIPSFAGLYLLASPISEMLYATPNAGGCIGVLAFGVILLGIGQVTTGVLQGLGHTAIPLFNMLAAAIVKVALSWLLTGDPNWGILGAAWATNADFGVAALLNLYFIYRYVGGGIRVFETLKVVFCTAVMGIAVLFLYDFSMRAFFSNTLATLLAIAAGGGVYAVMLLFTGSVKRSDVESIPKFGKKAADLLAHCRLVK